MFYQPEIFKELKEVKQLIEENKRYKITDLTLSFDNTPFSICPNPITNNIIIFLPSITTIIKKLKPFLFIYDLLGKP